MFEGRLKGGIPARSWPSRKICPDVGVSKPASMRIKVVFPEPDGPTSAAGGLVDPFTYSRAIEMNLDPVEYLRVNDSFKFLKSVGDLITTGPTQTNLMDLQILLAG